MPPVSPPLILLRRGAVRRAALLLTFALGTLASATAAADLATGNAIKKATSFVTPTLGSAHALTLSTYVTDAADLHYTTVPSGHAPLSASAIKNAAEQCAAASLPDASDAHASSGGAMTGILQQQLHHRHDAAPHSPFAQSSDAAAQVTVVAASTVRVARAQKVERRVDGLQPNTSYDVYFVAEVSGSNGVFGPVQAVLRSTTHPEPPTLDGITVRAANGSASAVEVSANLSAPGRVYFAFVPSAGTSDPMAAPAPTAPTASHQLSPLDLVRNRSLSELPTVFALHDTPAWSDLSVRKLVSGLASATLYDVLYIAEAVGDGDVRSDIARMPAAVRTHALPPDVVRVESAPQDASAEALVVDFLLRFDVHDVRRASAESLAFFSFSVHYEATRVVDATAAPPLSHTADNTETPTAAATDADTDADTMSDAVVRGVFPFGNFSSVEHFREQLALPQRGIIAGLRNGTSYRVVLRAETASSHGLIGAESAAAPCKTHARAPQILSANASAVNGSVHSLAVAVELTRGANVHYLVAPHHAMAIRHHFRDAPSMEHLVDLVRRDKSEFVYGVIELDTAGTGLHGVTDSSSTYTAAFQVDGLRDATAYTVVVMPETHASHGVFGKPFDQLLDAQTNENASDVLLRSVEPVASSTSSIELAVEMTKPNDVLYYCLDTALPLRASTDACHEVNRTTFQLLARTAASATSAVAFAVGNLTDDTRYFVSVFAENARRNGVLSAASSPPLAVKTHKPAPALVRVQAEPVAASTSRITTSVTVAEPCLVHFAVIEGPLTRDAAADTESPSNDSVASALPSAKAIIKDKWIWLGSSTSSSDPEAPAPQRQAVFVSQGRVFAADADAGASFAATKLKANTTYTVFVTTETSLTGNASGVYGTMRAVHVTTFAAAPTIIKATVDPTPDRTDSVVITANLSAPGVVHYVLSDVDFADPAVIRGSNASGNETAAAFTAPHVVRGAFTVHRDDMAMETVNGTNESRPVEPLMFVANMTVSELRSGATYHASLTTETRASGGVFGAFPPPILVTTHLPAPTVLASSLAVAPVGSSSTSFAIELALSRFGDVHYAVFFREIVRDHSDAMLEQHQRQHRRLGPDEQTYDASEVPESQATANATANATDAPHVWSPVHSSFDLAHLSASLLKRARVEDLGAGVWENGTISVSRDDVLTGKRIVKEITALPPNAVFDVCLVSETAGSNGIFDWVDSAAACHRVKTHADYSNQSMLLDEIVVEPVDAQTGSVRIEVHMSKLPGAPARVFPLAPERNASDSVSNDDDDDASVLKRFAVATGRAPYFILADGKEARRDFASNAFAASGSYDRSRDRASPGFKHAAAGAHHVAAAGMLRTVRAENDSHIVLTHEVHELRANHPYYLFVAYETSGSDGVFTKVNPHTHRSNDSKTQNDGIEVVTHEMAPALTTFAAHPTFGNTSRVTLVFDVVCASCREAIVHALVYPASCTRPSIDALKRFPVEPDSELDSAASDTSSDDPSGAPAAVDGGNSDANNGESDDERCRAPLTRRRFTIDMGERDHKALNVEREIFDARLRANASYSVFLATETANSSGVVSDHFVTTVVTTFARAPAFTYIRVVPRKGSTTELLLEFALDRPGEVHFMCGESGNAELNVTSPYNVSRKARPEKYAPRQHDYARDVVRLQRSVKAERAGEPHVAVLDYLTAGTSYDVFVVAESPESNGVYGRILEFLGVATHANPPMLLAHAAYATPGSKANLTVGFRIDTPGAVYFSVVQVDHWPQTQHVAHGSDVYGNRLAMREQLVAQQSIVVDASSSAAGGANDGGDDGWREVNISVPLAGTNYTVYLVTETARSDGVFGTVATHRNVRSHGEPPTALKLLATPTDARVDALTVTVQLTEAGHIHYVVLPHRQRRSEQRDAAVARGVIDVLANVSQATARDAQGGSGSDSQDEPSDGAGADDPRFEAEFIVEHLTEGTVFDLYFRCETLHSRGVFGAWTHFPISARTHGLPPDVLEELACAVSPSCDALGRESCTRTPNVCGDCLEGFTGALGSSNEPCTRTEGSSRSLKKSATIKISGVRVNPFASLESETQEQPPQQQSQDEPQEVESQEQESLEQPESDETHERGLEQSDVAPPRTESQPAASTASTEQPAGATARKQDATEFELEFASAIATALSDVLSDTDDGETSESEATSVSVSVSFASELESANLGVDSTAELASATSPEEPLAIVLACPPHSHIGDSGECECVSGYTRDPATNACELRLDELSPASPSSPSSHLPSDSARL